MRIRTQELSNGRLAMIGIIITLILARASFRGTGRLEEKTTGQDAVDQLSDLSWLRLF